MAFHALIAVPLSAGRPGGPRTGAGPVAPGAIRTRHRTGVHHTNPSASDTRVSMPSGQPLPQIFWALVPTLIPGVSGQRPSGIVGRGGLAGSDMGSPVGPGGVGFLAARSPARTVLAGLQCHQHFASPATQG